MIYKKVLAATFIKRPNRFLAHVLIDGKEEIVHVKNTGRCRELLVPGARVILEDCSHRPNRKTSYSLIAVWKRDMLVNMDSQVPNLVVYQALEEGKVLGLDHITSLRREVTYKNSRFDIYFEGEKDKGFMEIKGVTLEDEGIARFPDAPTARGRKHIEEMVDAVAEGYRGIIFFLIQMKGPRKFYPNWEMDQDFSQALKDASEKGVEIMAYDSIVGENSIILDKSVEISI